MEGGETNPASTNKEGNTQGGDRGGSPGQSTTTMLSKFRATYPMLVILTKQQSGGDKGNNPHVRDREGESQLESRP
jgi:hypothetical protein